MIPPLFPLVCTDVRGLIKIDKDARPLSNLATPDTDTAGSEALVVNSSLVAENVSKTDVESEAIIWLKKSCFVTSILKAIPGKEQFLAAGIPDTDK